MDKHTILKVREAFREKFNDYKYEFDGREGEIERVFRELLGEAEPEPEPYDPTTPRLSLAEFHEVMTTHYIEPMMKLHQQEPVLWNHLFPKE